MLYVVGVRIGWIYSMWCNKCFYISLIVYNKMRFSRILYHMKGDLIDIILSHDHRHIYISNNSSLWCYDQATQQCTKRCETTDDLYTLHLSFDDKNLYTSGSLEKGDLTQMLVWDTNTWNVLPPYKGTFFSANISKYPWMV